MGRSNEAMDVDMAVKTEKSDSAPPGTLKQETYEVNSENGSLSVSTKTEISFGDAPKPKRTRMLFSHLPSVKQEALASFTEIKESIYQYDDLGESQQQDVMACECKPLKSEDGMNLACGDNDCINFATSMECMDDECSCGVGCRNQRFQQRQYADVDVIQTDKKGYGIRANSVIPAHTFIYEYVGEVIEENAFRERMHDYDEQGIKHFYFMMIQQGEYIDATKKGGIGRFLNHSCAPNCYVDKWVVGTKLRMGIFADRNIQAGEELTFDYNVDRYGADAQPCFCGEPCCIGYIGGKTQSEAQPKLSHAVKEALGFDSDQDWSTAVSRKRRRAKKDDDDEDDDYVVAAQPKPVSEDGVAKIMSTLLQAREAWVIIKLLSRLETSDDTAIWHRVLKMHGYQILGAVLKEWRADNNIVTTALHILLKLPRVTKNKIDSSGIEVTVKELTENDNSRVKELATSLLQEWDTLEMGFRISRRPKGTATKSTSPMKDGTLSDSSKTLTTTTTTATTPTGPKTIQNTLHRPQKNFRQPSSRSTSYVESDPSFRNVPRGPASSTPSVPHPALPPGWSTAYDSTSKKTYYYRRADNKTQWHFPLDESIASTGSNLPKNDLAKYIEEANRQIAEREAAQKAEEEKKRLEKEREEQEAADAKAKERAERRLQKEHHHSHKGHGESNPDALKESKSKFEKELSQQFGKYVPNVIAGRYNALTKDEVKKHARDIVHLLVSKEVKAGKSHVKDELSDDKKRKIKIFVKDYMNKVMSRRAQKQQAKQNEPGPGLGPSESVSTADTPLRPGSTPRETSVKEIEPDTPASRGDSKTPLSREDNATNGDKMQSPAEFPGTLKKDGLLDT